MGGYSEFIFILADSHLSLAEIMTYFRDRMIKGSLIACSPNVAMFSISNFDQIKTMLDLGGTFKLGAKLGTIRKNELDSEEDLKRILDDIRFYDWLGDKIKFGVSVYNDKLKIAPVTYGGLVSYFQTRLKLDGAKKSKYVPPAHGKAGEFEIISNEAIRHDLVRDGVEVLLVNISDNLYVGKTLAIIDQKGYRHRDLDRPFQNPEISIPPRLARIMVNLTGAKQGHRLLDPFCGLGTILQEALIGGIDFLGVDIDSNRVRKTLGNLGWLTRDYRLSIRNLDKKVFIGDATRLSSYFDKESVDAIATEPILLPPLRRTPTIARAKEMLAKSSNVYAQALKEMSKVLKPSCRIAITVPYVKTREGTILTIPFVDIFRSSKLRPYGPMERSCTYPLFMSPKGDEKVLRGIYVLEKPQ